MIAPLALDMCPTCDGSGEVRKIDDEGWPVSDMCPTCGGGGLTVIEVESDDVATVVTIRDMRSVAERDAAWERFRECVSAMGRKP